MPVIPYVYPKNITTSKSLRRSKMSVGSISGVGAGVHPLMGTKGVSGAPSSASSQDNADSGIPIPQRSAEETAESEESIYATSSTSNTHDFMQLRAIGKSEGQFDALDFVIGKMRENMEMQGELLETMLKKVQQVSKTAIGLQIMQKTFEAIDQLQENNTESKSYGHF